MSSSIALWTVSPGGDDPECAYSSISQAPARCGPDRMFQSSRTDDNVPANSSSLSVDSITSDLNGTRVTCTDGGSGELIGSYNICIVGKQVGSHFSFMYKYRKICRRDSSS